MNNGIWILILELDTSIKERPYESKTLHNEFYENKILRTQIISLALENNDYDVLYNMRAREIPPQFTMTTYSLTSLNFSDYYDVQFIDAILSSKSEIVRYFCEEYYVESHWQKGTKFLWLYPFFDKLIIQAVKSNNSEAKNLLDVAIQHNDKTYNNLKRAILKVIKHMKETLFRNVNFQKLIVDVLRDFKVNEKNGIISFYCPFLGENSDIVATNIIFASVESKNSEIESKIHKLNELYSKIINIKDHLIKNS